MCCLPYFTWIKSGSASVSKIDVATCPLLLWWTITCLSPLDVCRELRRFLLLELRTRTTTMIASKTSNRHTLAVVISTGDTFNTSTPKPARGKMLIKQTNKTNCHVGVYTVKSVWCEVSRDDTYPHSNI